MSRWDYDTVFYRVFCITLLAVAFTFTVILTNVFVDIDGLLSKKDNGKPKEPPPEMISHDLSDLSRVVNVNMQPEDKSEDVYDDKDYQDSNDLYRSKRSLDKTDRIFHIKDPKLKKLLTNHLANLLDEIDQQDSNKNKNISTIENINYTKEKSNTQIENTEKTNDELSENFNRDKAIEDLMRVKDFLKGSKEEKTQYKVNKAHKDYKAELLHLAMHNVILQGIIENTDLNEVYNKVASLVKESETDETNHNKDQLRNLFNNKIKIDKRNKHPNVKLTSELNSIKDSLLLRDIDIKRSMPRETRIQNNDTQKTTTSKPKDHNVIIKTIIDITAMSNDKSNIESDLNRKDKINGVIKLIYNGNVFKFKRIDDENNTNSQNISHKLDLKANGDSKNSYQDINNHEVKPHESNQSYYQKVFYDYLKKIKGLDSAEQEKVFSSKRLKRHIKIRYDNNKTTIKPNTKKDDDELFVEIETHFDSKGTKGEKKKKLIRNLIEKIQSAIHSDNNALDKKKQKHWHVKKRIQDPLSSKSAAALINKLILPLETLAHRHLDPISKVVPLHEDMPLVGSVFVNSHWERPYYSPRFFGKSINSAELNTVDIDYNRVMRHNGVPQRLQKPLNTDMSDEVFQDSRVVDLGKIKFLMKDIDGSGFSIGFNQYTDEAPDPETMKLFSGLENILKLYHQQYDQESTLQRQQMPFDNARNISPDDINNNEEQVDKPVQHVIERRSIRASDENDYHLNNYRIVYDHSLPKNYNDIFNTNKPKVSKIKKMNVYSTKSAKKSTFIIDENVFEKNLRPAEILSMANLLQRKKRSIKVKKISNVKIKSKINRYLNTKKMATKSLFTKKKLQKRNKRQIDKIKIIARDLPQQGKSEEDNVFMVSDEKIFADRALLRDVELPEMEPNDKVHSIEQYDIISPEKEEEPYDIVTQTQRVNEDPEEHFDILSPYFYEVNPFENQNEFSRRARHNTLMSKYPHIIMEETPSLVNHGEEFLLDNIQQQQISAEATTITAVPTMMDMTIPNEQDITDLISPPDDHSNYRVSVKIRPKNSTNMSGFKEVHTSINKSYNKNGLTYTSLVNVSQLSKVEKVNKTMSRRDNDHQVSEQKVNIKQQQDIIKTLIQQHKHRLDMQLKHLQLERQKLETMYLENPETLSESVTEKVNTNTEKVNTKTKKGRKSLQSEARKKAHRETTTTQMTTTEQTTVTTTTEYIETTTEDVMKTKMIETIERNENITNELLKKIDQNTGVLKIFLGKLIATIEIPAKKATELSTSRTEKTKKRDRSVINNESSTNNAIIATKQPIASEHNIENNHIPFNFEDYHYMPNMMLRNMPRSANSSYGIPFVYAVQHPFGVLPDRDNMASVVYHGHIHTNTVNENNMKSPSVKVVLKDKIKIVTDKKNINSDFWKPKPGEKVLHDFVVNKNNSRFFLDETQNDFTAVPLSDKPKQKFALGLVNGTKI